MNRGIVIEIELLYALEIGDVMRWGELSVMRRQGKRKSRRRKAKHMARKSEEVACGRMETVSSWYNESDALSPCSTML